MRLLYILLSMLIGFSNGNKNVPFSNNDRTPQTLAETPNSWLRQDTTQQKSQPCKKLKRYIHSSRFRNISEGKRSLNPRSSSINCRRNSLLLPPSCSSTTNSILISHMIIPQSIVNAIARNTSLAKYFSAAAVAITMMTCRVLPTNARTVTPSKKLRRWTKISKAHYNDYNISIKMSPVEVVSRTFNFWRRAAPIILHYKFTQAWIAAKQYNREKIDEIYHNIHEMHADDALDIILTMRGEYHS